MSHPASEFRQCPFDECDWSTAEPMHEVEADAVAGGWDRLALHLQIAHGAYPDPDELAWEDGSWTVALFRSYESVFSFPSEAE